MIPRLDDFAALDPNSKAFCQELLNRGYQGDQATSYGDRLVSATDNSIYQLLPQLVLFPKNSKDVRLILKLGQQEQFKSLSITARGGGTGTNGQSLTQGVVVDLSRHMNQVLEVNTEEQWARVQPGVVLDQLNKDLKEWKLFFAPDLSPSNRATIGGMVSTDACGKGSRIYGKTSDHILELNLVLSDGSQWHSQSMGPEAFEQASDGDELVHQALRTVAQITTEKSELIEEKFPKLTRFLSGYNLNMVWNEKGEFNLNYLIAGSEGTLAFIEEIKVRLTPIPKSKILFLAKYLSFDDCLKAAGQLLSSDPAAIETIDSTILGLARQDTIWNQVGKFFSGPQDELVQAVNLIEFVAQDPVEMIEKVELLRGKLEAGQGLPGEAVGYVETSDQQEIAALWSLRKKGVGLLGNREGSRRPIPFVEDTVVPPENLAAYIKEFRAILDRYELDYGMFGHVDVGCLHVRPALDMKDENDEKLVRKITDEVKDLVLKYGGVVWGEHGKGLRSEFMPEFFGEELFQDIRKIKGAFDPDNRLNPGKICTPAGSGDEVFRLDEAPMRGQLDRQISQELRDHFQVSMNCNGNGACFNFDTDDVMCPSYKVTRERMHSPKGRAGMIREWARQLSNKGFSLGSSQQKGQSLQQEDFSHEVYAAMDGCLSCKACSTACPIKVDIPEQKARFLELYHSRYGRPLKDKLLAFGEQAHHRFLNVPFLYNFALQVPGFRFLLKKVFGIVDPPRLSSPNYISLLEARGIPVMTSFDEKPVVNERNVLILPDAITSFYEAETFANIVMFFKKVGLEPIVAPFIFNGKALHVKGFLTEFRHTVASNAWKLHKLAKLGMPMLGVDPAITLTYREEYRKYGLEDQSIQVFMTQEWLFDHLDSIKAKEIPRTDPKLLGHCGEKTSVGNYDRQWRAIFARFGIDLESVKVGCCGMAGAFGHEAHHLQESKEIFEQSWANKVSGASEFLATGASCRSQVERFQKRRLHHPLEWLAQQLD